MQKSNPLSWYHSTIFYRTYAMTYLAMYVQLMNSSVVYIGNLWFVQPMDYNIQHHIFQSINFPICKRQIHLIS